MRRPFIVGNWKMNTDRASAVRLATEIAAGAADLVEQVDVGICPPFAYLDAVGAALRQSGSRILLGAQTCSDRPNGAFTGEVSLAMLKDLGVQLVIAGHSERRHVIGESDDLVGRKVAAILDAGLQCILCIGETLEQRESGETDAVNSRQVRAGLRYVKPDQWRGLTIAYEPVWAIGTGRAATPNNVQAAQNRLRSVLEETFSPDAAKAIRIQYGGSVTPEMARSVFEQWDVDGGLIGGASLKADSFLGIIRAALV